MDTVVADQNGRQDLSGTAAQDQIEGETRLAGARGAADQHRAISDPDCGGVDGRTALVGHGAGSLTTKRAPAMVCSPSGPRGPRRFSAQMRPPCASMICFEIDRPS